MADGRWLKSAYRLNQISIGSAVCPTSAIGHLPSPIRPYTQASQPVTFPGPKTVPQPPSSRFGNQRGADTTKGRIANQ